MLPTSARTKRLLFALYLSGIALFTLALGYHDARVWDPWSIGDWLTNYSAGFVRRGLIGELFRLVASPAKPGPNWPLLALQSAAYLVLPIGVYRLTRGLRWSYAITALALSPATLAFTVLAPGGPFRKEILLFALMVFAVSAPAVVRMREWQLSLFLALATVALVLSHEGLLFYFPYLFAAVVLRTASFGKGVRIFALPLLCCAIASIQVLHHPGNYAMAQDICTSVGGQLHPVQPPDGARCSGAISGLRESLHDSHIDVQARVEVAHFYPLYGGLALLTLLPVAAALTSFYRRNGFHQEVVTIAGSALISFAASAMLFYAGTDWGRWIHMHAICLLLLVLTVGLRASSAPSPAPRLSFGLRAAASVAVLLYATCWTLPVIGESYFRYGYVDAYRFEHRVLNRH